jgi:hypothetical protein
VRAICNVARCYDHLANIRVQKTCHDNRLIARQQSATSKTEDSGDKIFINFCDLINDGSKSIRSKVAFVLATQVV